MGKMPIAAPQTEGRVFGTDWSIANVATLLRSNAARGVWRDNGTPGGYTPKLNQNYLRTVSARHLPTSVALIFMQLQDKNCWYASLCFSGADSYLPWNPEVAEQWLWALFGRDRPRLRGDSVSASHEPGSQGARQFTLVNS